jgi:hypothetical protein
MHLPLTAEFTGNASSAMIDGCHDSRMVFLDAQHSDALLKLAAWLKDD